MQNLLQFPTGLLAPLLILAVLYVLCSVIAWAAGDDEPVDEIRQGREHKQVIMQIKRVMRYDPEQRKFRLFRLMWNRGTVGDGKGYSVKLSVALRPRLWWWRTDRNEWALCLFGVDVHRVLSYGGRFV